RARPGVARAAVRRPAGGPDRPRLGRLRAPAARDGATARDRGRAVGARRGLRPGVPAHERRRARRAGVLDGLPGRGARARRAAGPVVDRALRDRPRRARGL
ncbi:MAG: hypothetical protein AVDCRST_MAG54-774, partial [uncultured Actinomycetospora sp.]